MRLFAGKVPTIAEELVRVLTADELIEVESVEEARLDIEAILKEQVRLEREVVDEAKRRMEVRGLPYAQLSKIKQQVAREKHAQVGDDLLPHLLDQLLEMMMHHSHAVTEVFGEDAQLRKVMTPVLRKHMDVEADLDVEVRAKIKNLEEGTADFEVEYARVLDQMKRKKGLQ